MLQHAWLEELGIHHHVVEHADCLLKRLAIQVLALTIDSNQITGAVDDAVTELRAFEDNRAEEGHSDFVKRLVLGEQVRAVEIAEYRFDIFHLSHPCRPCL